MVVKSPESSLKLKMSHEAPPLKTIPSINQSMKATESIGSKRRSVLKEHDEDQAAPLGAVGSEDDRASQGSMAKTKIMKPSGSKSKLAVSTAKAGSQGFT